MDDNDKQMTLPGMEDSDELTNPLTSSTKELVTELLQDAAQLTPQRRATRPRATLRVRRTAARWRASPPRWVSR